MSRIAHAVKEKARTRDVLISENVDFSSLLLSDLVSKGLKQSGFIKPSPIQLKAIPLGRCGLDLIVQAKSGTGKTCVFSVIALDSIKMDSPSIQVLVLAPTREIAVQIWEVIGSIGSAIPGFKCHTFIGGLPLHEDRTKLKLCHIAVGTPGRVKQLIEGGVLKTDSVRLFVLDEADKLLEEGFQQQINWIYSSLPENKQMLALSATYPEYLADHLTAYMRDPTFLRLNITDPTLLGIRQYVHMVPSHPMSHVVFEEKCKVLTTILSSVSFQQCLVFSNMQTRAQNLAESLTSKGWPTACIAGCLDQKERNYAMSKLKTYKCRILISTDLTSRGIDADKVNLIVNMDIPKDHETYLHRIGRAGRFGSFGIAITLVSEGQERMSLDKIEKRCHTHINPLPDPIPSDLAKSESPVYLDDVVSSEVIHTDDHHSPVKTKLSQISRGDTASNYSGTNGNVSPSHGTIHNAADYLNSTELNNDSKEEIINESSSEKGQVDNVLMNGRDEGFEKLTNERTRNKISKQKETLVKREDNNAETADSVTEINGSPTKAQPEPLTESSVNNCLTSEILLQKCNDLSLKPYLLNNNEAVTETHSETKMRNIVCSDQGFEPQNGRNIVVEKETPDTELKSIIAAQEIYKEIDNSKQDHESITESKMVNNVQAKEKPCVRMSRVVEKQSPKLLVKNKKPAPLFISWTPESVDLPSIFKQSIGFKHVVTSHDYFSAKQSCKEFVKNKGEENDPINVVQEDVSCNENTFERKFQFQPDLPNYQVSSGHMDKLLKTIGDLQEMFHRNILPESFNIQLEDDQAIVDESQENLKSELRGQSEPTNVHNAESAGDRSCGECTILTEHVEDDQKEVLTLVDDIVLPKASMSPEPDNPPAATVSIASKPKTRQKHPRRGYQGHFAIAHMLQNMDLEAPDAPDSIETVSQSTGDNDIEDSKSPENDATKLSHQPQNSIANTIGISCSNNSTLNASLDVTIEPSIESRHTISREKIQTYVKQAPEQVAFDRDIHDAIDSSQAAVSNSYDQNWLNKYNSQPTVPQYAEKKPVLKTLKMPSASDFDSENSESTVDDSYDLSDSSYEARKPAASIKYNRGATVDANKHNDMVSRPKYKSKPEKENNYDNYSEYEYDPEIGYPSYYGNHEDLYIPTRSKGGEQNSKQRYATRLEMSAHDQTATNALWYQQNYGNQYQNLFPWQQYPGNPSQQSPWSQNNGFYQCYNPLGMYPGYGGLPYPGNMYNPWNVNPQAGPIDLEASMKQAYDLQHQYIQAMSSDSLNTSKSHRKSKNKTRR